MNIARFVDDIGFTTAKNKMYADAAKAVAAEAAVPFIDLWTAFL